MGFIAGGLAGLFGGAELLGGLGGLLGGAEAAGAGAIEGAAGLAGAGEAAAAAAPEVGAFAGAPVAFGTEGLPFTSAIGELGSLGTTAAGAGASPLAITVGNAAFGAPLAGAEAAATGTLGLPEAAGIGAAGAGIGSDFVAGGGGPSPALPGQAVPGPANIASDFAALGPGGGGALNTPSLLTPSTGIPTSVEQAATNSAGADPASAGLSPGGSGFASAPTGPAAAGIPATGTGGTSAATVLNPAQNPVGAIAAGAPAPSSGIGGASNIAGGGSNVAASDSGFLSSLGLSPTSALGLAAGAGIGANALLNPPKMTPEQEQLQGPGGPNSLLQATGSQLLAGQGPTAPIAAKLGEFGDKAISGQLGANDPALQALSKFSSQALGGPSDTSTVAGATQNLATKDINAAAAGQLTQPQQAQIDQFKQQQINQLRQQMANQGHTDINNDSAYIQGVNQINQQAVAMQQQMIDSNAKTGLAAGGQVTGEGLQATQTYLTAVQNYLNMGMTAEQAQAAVLQNMINTGLNAEGQLSTNLLNGANLQVAQDKNFQDQIAKAFQAIALTAGLSSVGKAAA